MSTKNRVRKDSATKTAPSQAQKPSVKTAAPVSPTAAERDILRSALDSLHEKIASLQVILEIVVDRMFEEARVDGCPEGMRIASGLSLVAASLTEESESRFEYAWAAATPFFKGVPQRIAPPQVGMN